MEPVIKEHLYHNDMHHWLFKESKPYDFTVLEDETDADYEKKPEKERVFICKNCAIVITSPENIININGHHMHRFKNPAGIVFEIGCFKYAEGCITMGEPTSEFTWFPGYSWSYAICTGCYRHMGWYYSLDGTGFFGLILEYLTENY